MSDNWITLALLASVVILACNQPVVRKMIKSIFARPRERSVIVKDKTGGVRVEDDNHLSHAHG